MKYWVCVKSSHRNIHLISKPSNAMDKYAHTHELYPTHLNAASDEGPFSTRFPHQGPENYQLCAMSTETRTRIHLDWSVCTYYILTMAQRLQHPLVYSIVRPWLTFNGNVGVLLLTLSKVGHHLNHIPPHPRAHNQQVNPMAYALSQSKMSPNDFFRRRTVSPINWRPNHRCSRSNRKLWRDT